ncbi:MAG: PLP-dependent aminotransferase family protein, partial [Pseudomonadota bacterium]
ARQSFAMAGASLHPCSVDQDGLQLEALAHLPSRPTIVLLTPSHQFPTGARLSLGRRHHLVEWARRHGALIVEDDYDGEYRYDVPPLPPLAALAEDCVVYCGTFSKTMFPGLRVGFAAGPPAQIEAMARYQALTAYAPGEVVHRALAKFIDSGEFEKHVHRMRKRYAGKRRVLTQTIREHSPEAVVTGIDSGLNALVRLPTARRAEDICKVAATKGVLASALTRYCARPPQADDAIVIGYAAPEEEALVRGVECLLSPW